MKGGRRPRRIRHPRGALACLLVLPLLLAGWPFIENGLASLGSPRADFRFAASEQLRVLARTLLWLYIAWTCEGMADAHRRAAAGPPRIRSGRRGPVVLSSPAEPVCDGRVSAPRWIIAALARGALLLLVALPFTGFLALLAGEGPAVQADRIMRASARTGAAGSDMGAPIAMASILGMLGTLGWTWWRTRSWARPGPLAAPKRAPERARRLGLLLAVWELIPFVIGIAGCRTTFARLDFTCLPTLAFAAGAPALAFVGSGLHALSAVERAMRGLWFWAWLWLWLWLWNGGGRQGGIREGPGA